MAGRPGIPIDWDKVDELLIAGCMGTEVAAYFGMAASTFYGRVEEKFDCNFTHYSSEKKSKGESILRAHQYAKALGLTDKGDNTLLIWLGKTRLLQKEARDEVVQEQKVVFEVNYKNDSNDSVEILPKILPTSNLKGSE